MALVRRLVADAAATEADLLSSTSPRDWGRAQTWALRVLCWRDLLRRIEQHVAGGPLVSRPADVSALEGEYWRRRDPVEPSPAALCADLDELCAALTAELLQQGGAR